MTNTFIQRHHCLTFFLSVLFVLSYMHEISAQYKSHHHCGGDQVASSSDTSSISTESQHSHTQSIQKRSDSDSGSSPAQPASDCSCTHCSPGVATLITPFTRPSSNPISSELFPSRVLKPAKLSDGIDHPPNQS